MLPIFLCILLLSCFVVFKLYKKSFGRIILLALYIILILEIGSYGFLLYLISRGESFFLVGHQKFLDHLIKTDIIEHIYASPVKANAFFELDHELGYTIGPNKEYLPYSIINNRLVYPSQKNQAQHIDKSSAQGLRSLKNYTLMPDKHTFRVAVFGDSYVFGDFQPTVTTWPYYIEKDIRHIDVLNFGVSGYGLGQSYLRYLKDGLRFHPDLIIFNYILLGPRDTVLSDALKLDNLNLRHSTFYRVYFYQKDGLLFSRAVTPFDFFNKEFRKNHVFKKLSIDPEASPLFSRLFSFSNTALLIKHFILNHRLKNITVKQAPLDVSLNVLLLKNLIQTARQNNTAIIFFCPHPFHTLPQEIQKLFITYQGQIHYVHSSQALEAKFKQKGVASADLLNPTDHYNELGNSYYAEVILSILLSRTWGEGKREFRYDQQQRGFVNVSSP